MNRGFFLDTLNLFLFTESWDLLLEEEAAGLSFYLGNFIYASYFLYSR